MTEANRNDAIIVLTTVAVEATPAKAPGDAISIQADHLGNVLFRQDAKEIPKDLAERSFKRCLSMAQQLATDARDAASAWEVTSITLKLGLDTKVGFAFVADAKLATAVEVKIERVADSAATK